MFSSVGWSASGLGGRFAFQHRAFQTGSDSNGGECICCLYVWVTTWNEVSYWGWKHNQEMQKLKDCTIRPGEWEFLIDIKSRGNKDNRNICGFAYMNQLPTYSRPNKRRQSDRLVHTHSPKQTTKWNLALSLSNLNIASALLIDPHAGAHTNMLFSLLLPSHWNTFGFFRCQYVTLLVNPNLKMPK